MPYSMKKKTDDKTESLQKPNGVKILAFSIALFALLVFLIHKVGGRPPGRISVYKFDRSLEGFEPVGEPLGKMRLVKNPEGLEKGDGALQYEYENRVDHFTGVGTLNARLDNFKQINLWVRTDEERTLGVVADEYESGAVYVYSFKVKPGKWHKETCPSDFFILSPGSKDTNNLLDTDRMNNRLIIADLSGFEGVIGPNRFTIARVEIVRPKQDDNKNREAQQ